MYVIATSEHLESEGLRNRTSLSALELHMHGPFVVGLQAFPNLTCARGTDGQPRFVPDLPPVRLAEWGDFMHRGSPSFQVGGVHAKIWKERDLLMPSPIVSAYQIVEPHISILLCTSVQQCITFSYIY